MQEVLTIDFRRPVAVFPLPDSVLLPHTLLPLHIFEPRYRQMVTDALDDVGLVAMGMFDQTVSSEDYLHGHPPLRPWVCLGLIRRYEKLLDGRYFLILQGICRARILEEPPHEPYRIATLEPADISPRTNDRLNEYRARIERLAREQTLADLPLIRKARAHLVESLPVPAVVDGILSELLTEAETRYTMLAETDPVARAQWLIQYLESLRDGT
ncbi:MAG: LON peptidase substrate-binding domain-containing protein [Lentisphaerae bacterium]|nr:LON peptidase substrate-binding domain-containing protein [Lentisphaerota bacterium]